MGGFLQCTVIKWYCPLYSNFKVQITYWEVVATIAERLEAMPGIVRFIARYTRFESQTRPIGFYLIVYVKN